MSQTAAKFIWRFSRGGKLWDGSAAPSAQEKLWDGTAAPSVQEKLWDDSAAPSVQEKLWVGSAAIFTEIVATLEISQKFRDLYKSIEIVIGSKKN